MIKAGQATVVMSRDQQAAAPTLTLRPVLRPSRLVEGTVPAGHSNRPTNNKRPCPPPLVCLSQAAFSPVGLISARPLFIQIDPLGKDWPVVIGMCEALGDLPSALLGYCIRHSNNHIQL